MKYYVIMHKIEPFHCIHLLSKTGICFMVNENRFRVALFDTEAEANLALEKARKRYGHMFDVFEVRQG